MARNKMSVHAGFDAADLFARSDEDVDPISAVVLCRDGEWDGGLVLISDPDVLREFVAWATGRGHLTEGKGISTARHGYVAHRAITDDDRELDLEE